MSLRRSPVSPRALRRAPHFGLALVLVLALLLSAAGSADAQAATINYGVSRAGATQANFGEFGRIVDAVLDDPRPVVAVRGGPVQARLTGRTFTVRLTDPRVVGSW